MKPSIMNKVKTWIVVAMIFAMIFIIVATVEIFDYMLSKQQNAEIDQLSQVITNTIDNSIYAEEVIESYLIQLLGIEIEEIIEHINDIDQSKWDKELLENIMKDYKLSGVALFVDQGNDIVIENSTSETEIGRSTKKWGFWYDAFRQLFDNGTVSLDRGFSDGAFWVGPRSLAYGQDGYYLFAYYKIPNKPYLLNIYVNDSKAFGLVKENDPNKLLAKMTEISTFIDEISVVNVEAWNARFTESNRTNLQDFTIHYGKHTYFKAEDIYYLNKVNNMSQNESMSFDFVVNGNEYTKMYKKVSKDTVMTFVMNHLERRVLKQNMIYIIVGSLVFIGFLAFLIITYFTSKYSDLLDIERERLFTAEEFKHTVRILPSMIFRLKQLESEIVVLYCEGKALSELDIIAEESKNQSLELILPQDYLDVAWEAIESAFAGDSKYFEYRKNNKIYNNMVTPVSGSSLSENKEIIIFANDVTRLRNSEERAKHMAYHDSLTLLPNRHYFKETIEDFIGSKEASFTICFIDLDGFKNVNDTSGHDMGDELLKEVAHRIKKHLSDDDFAARMGGDEFAIIYKGILDREIIASKLIALKNILSEEYIIKEHYFKISASIGVSQYPVDGLDYTTLLKKADIALYDVKYSGKNNFAFYMEKFDAEQ